MGMPPLDPPAPQPRHHLEAANTQGKTVAGQHSPILPQVGDVLPFWTILSTELPTAEHRHTRSLTAGGGGGGGGGRGVRGGQGCGWDGEQRRMKW